MANYTYYCPMRPPMPGAIPTAGLRSVESFDERTFIPEIGREAWGTVTYGRPLTRREILNYELIEAPKGEIT